MAGATLAAAIHADQAAGASIDPASAAVVEACIGPVSTQKVDAALAGLTNLIAAARATPGFSAGGFSSGFFVTGSFNVGFGPGLNFGGNSFSFINSTITASSDTDLAPYGNPVLLDHALLRALASFATPRDFTIGAGAASIDTNGFNLTFPGRSRQPAT